MKTLYTIEADQLVAEYLFKNNIKYNVIYTGDKSQDKDWPCDYWLIQFNGVGFDYKTGIGHRMSIDVSKSFSLGYKDKAKIKEIKELLGLNHNDKVIFETNKKGTFAVSPTHASVLYCLLLDSSALDTSFTYWADEFGYDQDSLKALNIYNSCCDNAKLLNTVFNRQQQNDLSELLEDY